MRKWNWSLCGIIVLLALVGALGNKTIPDIKTCLIVGLGFGVPVGLLWAWITKE